MSLDDQELLEREYASSERLERRRHNVTGRVCGEEPWVEALAASAEILRSGGRFGVYNRDRHMEELWSSLHPASAEGDDYHELLARHFSRVEERDTEAHTLWQTRRELRAFLDASAELLGPLEAPAAPYPFTVTRRNRVYVAEKAS